MSIKEKAEQYAREKLGDWGSVVHSAYETNECTNSEISVQDYTAGYDEAISQPKHIFDGAAVAGEVRRFEAKVMTVKEAIDYIKNL